MTQCFVRLDDRVVLIHLVGEGDRTVLKGRLEIPLDLWKPDPRKPHLLHAPASDSATVPTRSPSATAQVERPNTDATWWSAGSPKCVPT
ncbi:MAG: hypothetical protein CM15mP128_1420 [Methanobacteriota archaeon]|nr:MAG: hypothetical protein CM15mP128_1420 [Euryarchaeota archaeon]